MQQQIQKYLVTTNFGFIKAGLTFLFLFLMAGFTTGCISSKGVKPHAKNIEANDLEVGKTISAAKAGIAWPNEDWWKLYGDQQLDALIIKTLSASPTLREAQARVAMSQAYVDSTHAESLPNVGAGADFTRERFTELQFIPPPSAGNSAWNNKMAASLSYDLDLWGRQESIWKGAVDETLASSAEVQQVELELVTAVVRNYIQLSMQYALRDIAVERLTQVKQRVSIVSRSLAAGLSTGMAVSEAETPLPLANAKIEAIDEHIALLRNQLAALSGQGPGAGDHISRPILVLEAPIGLPDALPANLIGRRPDVLAQRWRIEAATQSIDGAKAAFYPNINLIAFIGFQALGFGQLISNAAAISGVGPAVSLPIFDGGRRRSNLSAKTASYDMAIENYNNVIVRALQDVSDQLVILQSNAKQHTEVEKSLVLAQKTYTLSKVSYHAGIENYQHVLDVQTAVLNQQEIACQLQAVRLSAYAGLMKALGGGVMESASTAKATVGK